MYLFCTRPTGRVGFL